MNLGLSDKVALVTAASRGLGFALAQELVREGAQVMICARTQAHLDAAVDQMRSEFGSDAPIAARVTNVRDADAVEELVAATVAEFGGLDILVTNAGGPPGGTFDTLPQAEWDAAIELTLLSAVRLIRAALPHLRQSVTPSILTLTSYSVRQPIEGLLLSNAIRPAVVGLTKSLALELGPENIRVNSLLPGWTATERVEEILAYRARQNDSSVVVEEARITAEIPLRRMASPAEFARVAAFLVSPAASYVTGVMLSVDGGATRGLL